MPTGVYKRPTLEENFRNGYTVNPQTGCWEWKNSVGKNQYGHMGIGKKTSPAHRVSYELFIGEIPEGLFICHKCDNKPCVNPMHLFVGTQKDNMTDAQSKGIIPTAPHPSHTAYVAGCRCIECCECNTAYNKKWRDKNEEHKKQYDKTRRSTPEYKAKAREQYLARKNK